MIARLATLAALLTASASFAQEPQPAPSERPPATAEQIRVARQHADALIAAADAGDFFENTTKNASAQVTHRRSGLVCGFDGHARDRIMVFPSGASGIPRGDDVGCVSYLESLDTDLTLYATRYPQPRPTQAAVLDDAIRAIRSRWPDAQPFQGELTQISTDDFSPRSSAWNIRLDGIDKLTIAVVGHRGEWSFKARATGPRDEPMGLSLIANMMLVSGVMEREAD